MNHSKPAGEPRLSSTILLIRGDEDPEVLMVARNYQIDFASGAMVFPGGKVCDDDYRDDWKAHVDGQFEDDDRVVRIGGVRELFEESGLLLARHRSVTSGHVDQSVCDVLAPHRKGVDRGEESFLDLITKHDLVLCLDALVPYAHWITPTMMPKRFDTRFFVAVAPEGQHPVHDGYETTEAIWTRPGDVLEREKEGRAILLFPTRVNLEMLEDSGSVDSILSTSRKRKIVTVLPVIQEKADGNVLIIPAEAGYRVTEEPLQKVMKTV